MLVSIYQRKGESLVEVLVALTVIMLIFSGVVGIITASVTLNLSSRQRTMTVAKVQKNLNEYMAQNSGSDVCKLPAMPVDSTIVIESRVNGVDPNPSCTIDNGLTTVGDYCYWVEIKALEDSEADFIGSDRFIKVVSHGKWYARLTGEDHFQVARLVRKD